MLYGICSVLYVYVYMSTMAVGVIFIPAKSGGSYGEKGKS